MNTTGKGRPGRHATFLARTLSYGLIVFGAAALGYSAYVLEDAREFQASALRSFEKARTEAPASEPELDASSASEAAPAEAPPETAERAEPAESMIQPRNATISTHEGNVQDDVIGRLRIPRLGIDVMVADGDSNVVLRRAVGHVNGTPFPGETGNVGLAGHRDSFFRPLRNIRDGDLIAIDTLSHQYQYKVDWFAVVEPENVSPLAASDTNELTLVTCFPFDYVGSAPSRFIVRAHQFSEHAPGSQGPEDTRDPKE